jgi:hypothetical protein
MGQNRLHITNLKALEKGIGPGSTAMSELGVSPGAGPLETKAREDSVRFQCQSVGLSHGSLTYMQDVTITKQPA